MPYVRRVARSMLTADIPARRGHLHGRRGIGSAEGLPANVVVPPATRSSDRPHHVRQDGPGSRVGVQRLQQELRVPRHEGSATEAGPGHVR